MKLNPIFFGGTKYKKVLLNILNADGHTPPLDADPPKHPINDYLRFLLNVNNFFIIFVPLFVLKRISASADIHCVPVCIFNIPAGTKPR